MLAIYSRLLGVACVLTGCVAAEPGTGPAESEVASLASGSTPSAAGAPAAAGVTLPSNVAPTCSSDADCRLVPDYCAECACVSLNAQQIMPECLGEELKCVVNPCAEHLALCINGRCSAESSNLR
jgi:hypothetical protein